MHVVCSASFISCARCMLRQRLISEETPERVIDEDQLCALLDRAHKTRPFQVSQIHLCRRRFENYVLSCQSRQSCRVLQAGSLCSPDRNPSPRDNPTPTAARGFPTSGGVLSDTLRRRRRRLPDGHSSW